MSLSGGGERAPAGAIRRVGVVARAGGQGVLDSLVAVVQTLRAAGADVTLEAETARMLSSPHGVARPAIGDGMDLVVVVGGDGSILGVARDVARTDVAVLGVNRGGLGFLADISPDQIAAKLPAVLRGEHTVEERFLLEARVWRDGRSRGAADPALNDVVVHAGSMSRMMDFSLFVDDEFVYSQRVRWLDRLHANRLHRLRALRRRADHASALGRDGDSAHVSAHAHLAPAGGPRPIARARARRPHRARAAGSGGFGGARPRKDGRRAGGERLTDGELRLPTRPRLARRRRSVHRQASARASIGVSERSQLLRLLPRQAGLGHALARPLARALRRARLPQDDSFVKAVVGDPRARVQRS